MLTLMTRSQTSFTKNYIWVSGRIRSGMNVLLKSKLQQNGKATESRPGILKADFDEFCKKETRNKKWVDISSVLEYFYEWSEEADREEIYDRIKECLYLIIDRVTFRDYYSEDCGFSNANKSFKPLDEYVEFVRVDKEE